MQFQVIRRPVAAVRVNVCEAYIVRGKLKSEVGGFVKWCTVAKSLGSGLIEFHSQ